MADKADRMKARLPRGFVDRHAADIRAVDAMTAKIRAVYELYGFDPVEQPMVEYTDALGKFLPDQDRPNEGVFSFQDDDEQWLSLRYDLTAPLARFVAENFETLPKPYRSYRAGWVFRNEKPGPGRFRQFMQFDADIVGTPGVAADAEMAMMMADTLEAVGIAPGDLGGGLGVAPVDLSLHPGIDFGLDPAHGPGAESHRRGKTGVVAGGRGVHPVVDRRFLIADPVFELADSNECRHGSDLLKDHAIAPTGVGCPLAVARQPSPACNREQVRRGGPDACRAHGRVLRPRHLAPIVPHQTRLWDNGAVWQSISPARAQAWRSIKFSICTTWGSSARSTSASLSRASVAWAAEEMS